MTQTAAETRATAAERLNSYITDMHALEVHIEKALSAQIRDLDQDEPEVATALTSAHATIVQHAERLDRLVASRDIDMGGMMAGGVKKIVSAVAGFGAAAVDLVRSEDLPKDLRDDFAAFSLATVGYAMLHASAVVLADDAEVADLALAHRHDYVRMTTSLGALAPASVLRFLEKEGFAVSASHLDQVRTAPSAAAPVP